MIVCIARFSWPSPPRFIRCLSVGLEEAGIGAPPAKQAKAASERNRPGCDQLTRIHAAVIGPTPSKTKNVGVSWAMGWRRSFSHSRASAWRCWMRWAVERRARGWSCDARRTARGGRGGRHRRDLLRSAEATQLGTEAIRCGDDQCLELVDSCGGGAHSALPGGQQRAQRLVFAFPVASGGWMTCAVARAAPCGWLKQVRLAASTDRRTPGRRTSTTRSPASSAAARPTL